MYQTITVYLLLNPKQTEARGSAFYLLVLKPTIEDVYSVGSPWCGGDPFE